VIDPGHPSEINSGRKVVNGVSELEANWLTALRLESLLQKIPGLHVVKTREKRDVMMTNQDRAKFANTHRAALFLRLHCDAGPGHGFTVYYPDRTGKHKGTVGPSAEVITHSRRAAQCLHAGFRHFLGKTLRDNGIRGEGKTAVGGMYGALIGSIYSEVPTATVEMLFLTDPFDASLVKSPDGRDLLAHALADGVKRFLALKSPRPRTNP
jgi:N-acetylmuramoyl-L-alanine amidase